MFWRWSTTNPKFGGWILSPRKLSLFCWHNNSKTTHMYMVFRERLPPPKLLCTHRMTFREGSCELYIYSSCYRHPHLIPTRFLSKAARQNCLANWHLSALVSQRQPSKREIPDTEPWRRSCECMGAMGLAYIYLYTYIPWDPKIMKNKGLGHLKTRSLIIKTSKNIGFWGPMVCIYRPQRLFRREHKKTAWHDGFQCRDLYGRPRNSIIFFGGEGYFTHISRD